MRSQIGGIFGCWTHLNYCQESSMCPSCVYTCLNICNTCTISLVQRLIPWFTGFFGTPCASTIFSRNSDLTTSLVQCTSIHQLTWFIKQLELSLISTWVILSSTYRDFKDFSSCYNTDPTRAITFAGLSIIQWKLWTTSSIRPDSATDGYCTTTAGASWQYQS